MEEIAKKILVIRFSSMGDVILTAPLFVGLKKQYPDCLITFLTDLQYAQFFVDDSNLYSIIGIKKDDLSAVEQLNAQAWDLVVDLQKNRKSRRIIRGLQCCKKTGVLNKMHLQRALLLGLRIGIYPAENSIVTRYYRAAGLDGKEIASLQLHFNGAMPQFVEDMLKTSDIVRPCIALFPFSAWVNKIWPLEYFVEVGSFFIVKGWNVLILGGPSEQNISDLLASYIGQRCFSLSGRLTLYECGTVLKNCDLALGNDTGLTHLARACGVKTGVIFGSTTRHFGFYPYGEPSFKVFESSLWCRPCHAHGGNNCLLGKLCMKKIQPEYVIKGLMELIIQK